MSSSLSAKITNIVWGLFNGRCAMCELVLARTLVDGESGTIGKIAHIVGENKGSARYTDTLTLEQRNSPDNLMLLCGTHHDTVDNYESEFSVDDLHVTRKKFLDKLASVFEEQVLGVTFADLEVTITYLVSNSDVQYEGTLEIITPYEKIEKNSLSADVENLLKMGLIRQTQLEDYLNKNLDATFSARLRNLFVEEYNRLKNEELSSDEIFYKLLEFASGNNSEFPRQAAGLTIVAYYFNVCDIFEK